MWVLRLRQAKPQFNSQSCAVITCTRKGLNRPKNRVMLSYFFINMNIWEGPSHSRKVATWNHTGFTLFLQKRINFFNKKKKKLRPYIKAIWTLPCALVSLHMNAAQVYQQHSVLVSIRICISVLHFSLAMPTMGFEAAPFRVQTECHMHSSTHKTQETVFGSWSA